MNVFGTTPYTVVYDQELPALSEIGEADDSEWITTTRSVAPVVLMAAEDTPDPSCFVEATNAIATGGVEAADKGIVTVTGPAVVSTNRQSPQTAV